MCKVEWCSGKPNVSGRGYCRKHYDQIRKYGKILDIRSIYDPNRYALKGDIAEIIITDGQDRYICSTIVDADRLDEVLKYRWTENGNGYIRTFIRTKPLYLHRLIAGAEQGEDVDHINHDRLDNRAANLRRVSHIENCNNRGDHKGSVHKVTDRKLAKPYYAALTVRGKRALLGYYATEAEAWDAINAHLATV